MPMTSEHGNRDVQLQMAVEPAGDPIVEEADERAGGDGLPRRQDASESQHGKSRRDGDIEAWESAAEPPPQNPWIGLPRWRKVAVFTGLYLGLFLATLDTSIVATSLVTIIAEFNNFGQSPWVVLAYLVAYMSFAIAFARLSDIYGRKNAVLGAWIVFTAFSIACGVATSMIQLIIFRSLQGVGGSGLFSLAMILIPEATPTEKMGLTSGLIGMVLGCSGVLGPILGGLISHLTTWRWIFYLNAPVGGLVILSILLTWPDTRGLSICSGSGFLSIDFLGIFLIIAANCLHIYGFECAGSEDEEWSSPEIIALLLSSACCWVSFVAWELYLDSRPNTPSSLKPLFPFRIVLKHRVMAAVVVSTFLTGFPFITVIITLPERFQLVNGASPLIAGLHLLPLLASSAFGSFIGGALANLPSKSNRKRPTSLGAHTSLPATEPRPTTNITTVSTAQVSHSEEDEPRPPPFNITPYTLLISSILQLIGIGLLSTLSSTTKVLQPKVYAFEAILGFGIGISLATTTIMASVLSSPADLAAAQGAIAQVRFLGGIIGLTIATTLFNRKSNAALVGKLSQTELTMLHMSPLAALSFDAKDQVLVRETYARFFGMQMRVLMYICIAGVVVAACAWQKREKRVGVVESLQRHQGVGLEMQECEGTVRAA